MTTRILDVHQGVLSKNDVLATELRKRFHAAGVTVMNRLLPGAGKTALLERPWPSAAPPAGRRPRRRSGHRTPRPPAGAQGVAVRQIITAGHLPPGGPMVDADLTGRESGGP